MSQPTGIAELSLPIELAPFVQDRLGDVRVVADLSWPYEGSEVYRIRDEDGTDHILKRLIDDTFYARETAGYAWASALGRDRAPRLEAADPHLRVVVTTFLPGVLLKEAYLDPARSAQAYRQVGELLRRLHDSAAPVADSDVIDRLVAQTDTHIERVGAELDAAQRNCIHRAAQQLATVAASMPSVPTHGDFWPRNLLIDLDSGTVAVIDFERAALAPAVRDLVRLETGVFTRSPAARDAFYTGYGRDLMPVEATALRAWAVLDALSALAWALAHNDTHLLEHARRILSSDDSARQDGRHPEAAL
ncbi:phosphotransferase enzyme family protein [Actinospica robiniae]|uniref:phosphotransferase enzyme family protein n=1 Tax=Actinospica robiniae TaxID=304901 RepID=UPI0003F827C9|nr:aminoglycoside phosphotransferase family protein [Actinospica robiniae]